MDKAPRGRCRVCALIPGERDLLEGGVLSGWSPRSLAARFGTLTRRDVRRHAERCMETEAKKKG